MKFICGQHSALNIHCLGACLTRDSLEIHGLLALYGDGVVVRRETFKKKLSLESTRDRSTGHWWGKQPPLNSRAPLRKANLRPGVFTLAQPEADRWSAKWICYCLVCLGSPWERHTDCCPRCLQYAHTHTRTRAPTGTYGSFSVTFSVCYCGIPSLASKHPPLALIIAAGGYCYFLLSFPSWLLPVTY